MSPQNKIDQKQAQQKNPQNLNQKIIEIRKLTSHLEFYPRILLGELGVEVSLNLRVYLPDPLLSGRRGLDGHLAVTIDPGYGGQGRCVSDRCNGREGNKASVRRGDLHLLDHPYSVRSAGCVAHNNVHLLVAAEEGCSRNPIQGSPEVTPDQSCGETHPGRPGLVYPHLNFRGPGVDVVLNVEKLRILAKPAAERGGYHGQTRVIIAQQTE